MCPRISFKKWGDVLAMPYVEGKRVKPPDCVFCPHAAVPAEMFAFLRGIEASHCSAVASALEINGLLCSCLLQIKR